MNVSAANEATFIEGDIRNEALMTEILHDHAIEAVIHFAGLKAVGESVAKPLEYYDNNVTGTLTSQSPPCAPQA